VALLRSGLHFQGLSSLIFFVPRVRESIEMSIVELGQLRSLGDSGPSLTLLARLHWPTIGSDDQNARAWRYVMVLLRRATDQRLVLLFW
jgi:hypothetical protein